MLAARILSPHLIRKQTSPGVAGGSAQGQQQTHAPQQKQRASFTISKTFRRLSLNGYASPEKLLLSSGAPILVIPSGWKSESIGNKILVGWNASREARRALADGLPFLAASSVTLLVVDSEQRAGRHGEEPGADIALYLARHGAHIEVEQVLSQGAPVADTILSYAAEHDVDLIVIDAYSHARPVEMVFGGCHGERVTT
jgi:nucleotide-binding universal stress UspA family protein